MQLVDLRVSDLDLTLELLQLFFIRLGGPVSREHKRKNKRGKQVYTEMYTYESTCWEPQTMM